jgi:hypothetical protein
LIYKIEEVVTEFYVNFKSEIIKLAGSVYYARIILILIFLEESKASCKFFNGDKYVVTDNSQYSCRIGLSIEIPYVCSFNSTCEGSSESVINSKPFNC